MSEAEKPEPELTPEQRAKRLERIEMIWGKVTSDVEAEAITALQSVRRNLAKLGKPFHEWLGERTANNQALEEQVTALTERLTEYVEANEELKAGEEVLLGEVKRLTMLVRHFRPKPTARQTHDVDTLKPLLRDMSQSLASLAGPFAMAEEQREQFAAHYQAQVGEVLHSTPTPLPTPNILASCLLSLLSVVGYPYPQSELVRLRQLTKTQADALAGVDELAKEAKSLSEGLPALQDTVDLLLEGSGNPTMMNELMHQLAQQQIELANAKDAQAFAENMTAQQRERAEKAEARAEAAERGAPQGQAQSSPHTSHTSQTAAGAAAGHQADPNYGSAGMSSVRPAFKQPYVDLAEEQARELSTANARIAALEKENGELKTSQASGQPIAVQLAALQEQLQTTTQALDLSSAPLEALMAAQRERSAAARWQALFCASGSSAGIFFVCQTFPAFNSPPALAFASALGGAVAGVVSYALGQSKVFNKLSEPLHAIADALGGLRRGIAGATASTTTALRTVKHNQRNVVEEAEELNRAAVQARQDANLTLSIAQAQRLRNAEEAALLAQERAAFEKEKSTDAEVKAWQAELKRRSFHGHAPADDFGKPPSSHRPQRYYAPGPD